MRVPRDREGTFQTELFESYHWITGSVEEAVLEMYLQGVSTRKVEAVTEALAGRRVGKDAVSGITARLQEAGAGLAGATADGGVSLPLPGRHLAGGQLGWEGGEWGQPARTSRAVGRGGGCRGASGGLAESAAGLVDRGLKGVRLVISDDHEAIKAAGAAVCGGETAEALARQFVSRWESEFPGAVERLFEEIKRRTRVVGVFPEERSLITLTTTVAVRVTEE